MLFSSQEFAVKVCCSAARRLLPKYVALKSDVKFDPFLSQRWREYFLLKTSEKHPIFAHPQKVHIVEIERP
jgi:hypothetical protein